MKGFTSIILPFLLGFIVISMDVESRVILDQPNTTHHTNVTSTKLAKVTNAKAMLTINSFEKGGDGGGPSECDGKYHSDDTLIVALSTGWYANGQRCNKFITVNANGRSVSAKVVDECDVKHDHCKTNIVDGSKAVWKALGASRSQWGLMAVTWSDQ
ncbi:Putative ripening-related protein 2 [Linum perenne]